VAQIKWIELAVAAKKSALGSIHFIAAFFRAQPFCFSEGF
jgi:hypothetical protein